MANIHRGRLADIHQKLKRAQKEYGRYLSGLEAAPERAEEHLATALADLKELLDSTAGD